ncbi:MAG TPA: hypothetical protein PKC21_00950 [Oligoflexia bacterium]|nr:hypothetical protein [Oligoflexia bacterium]
MVLTGGTVFVKVASNAFKQQTKQYSVNLEQKNKEKLMIAIEAEKEAQEALDAYYGEVYAAKAQSKESKKAFKFDAPKHDIKDIDIKDIDLASLKTDDLNSKFTTQDSDVHLRLWKKNPKEFLNNKI